MRTDQTTTINQQIGKILRAKRLQLGKSQEEIGKRVGVSFQQIHKYESGQHSLTIERALSICRALGLRLDDIEPHESASLDALERLPTALAKNFQKLSEEGQATLMALVRSLLKAESHNVRKY